MDLTRLFLGDVLDGIDLGGLSKLGYNVTAGLEEGDSAGQSPKANKTEADESDSSESSDLDVGMPPLLY